MMSIYAFQPPLVEYCTCVGFAMAYCLEFKDDFLMLLKCYIELVDAFEECPKIVGVHLCKHMYGRMVEMSWPQILVEILV